MNVESFFAIIIIVLLLSQLSRVAWLLLLLWRTRWLNSIWVRLLPPLNQYKINNLHVAAATIRIVR